MEEDTSAQSKKATKEGLLEHYSNETCSHVEAAISLFFGLIGTLILMTIVNTVAARVVFSIMYFVLGLLGVYFYARLFYYRTLLDEILLDKPYKDYHTELQDRAFKRSIIIRLTQQISRRGNGEYNLYWAWAMLSAAVVVAIASWVIVVLSL
jgi:hypothetical protein